MRHSLFPCVGKKATAINVCEYSSGRYRRIMFNCILVMLWNVDFFVFSSGNIMFPCGNCSI